MKHKVTINRRKWSRGNIIPSGIDDRDFTNQLWFPESNMGCCLGHAIIQTHGVSEDYLTVGTPDNIDNDDVKEALSDLYLRTGEFDDVLLDSAFVDIAIDINDNKHIEEGEREKRLIELFAENDIELSFYN